MKVSRGATIRAGLLAAVVGGVIALSSGAGAAAASGGTLYVLQGLPGAAADVSVDGARVASGVAATSVVGPLPVAAGRHVIELRRKGARLVAASVTVPAG